MWDQLLTSAMSNGIWAVLFCSLLVYQLKDSKRRELKYNDIIDGLSERLKCVEDIEERVCALDKNVQLLVASKQ